MDEIKRLQQEMHMGLILITHDLGVIAETCSRVVVMYCGKIIEIADTKELYANPRHPYTRGLLESIPRVRKEKLKTLPTIKGMVPDLSDLPTGCRFADRCPKVETRCREEEPVLEDTEGGGQVACFRPN